MGSHKGERRLWRRVSSRAAGEGEEGFFAKAKHFVQGWWTRRQQAGRAKHSVFFVTNYDPVEDVVLREQLLLPPSRAHQQGEAGSVPAPAETAAAAGREAGAAAPGAAGAAVANPQERLQHQAAREQEQQQQQLPEPGGRADDKTQEALRPEQQTAVLSQELQGSGREEEKRQGEGKANEDGRRGPLLNAEEQPTSADALAASSSAARRAGDSSASPHAAAGVPASPAAGEAARGQGGADISASPQAAARRTPSMKRLSSASASSGASALASRPASWGDTREAFLRGVKASNEIHTAKYSVWSFFPLVLFYQVTRFSNFYFLCVAMLQLVPPISDSGGVPTYLIPLSVILALAVLKELFEDFGRHRSDAEENAKRVMVFEHGACVLKQWRDLRVGDVVKVRAGEQFPADLVLLGCSHDYGVCHVETKNVDGESNIKSKFCLLQLSQIFSDDQRAAAAKVQFVCEPPSDNLHSFSGKVVLPKILRKKGEAPPQQQQQPQTHEKGLRKGLGAAGEKHEETRDEDGSAEEEKDERTGTAAAAAAATEVSSRRARLKKSASSLLSGGRISKRGHRRSSTSTPTPVSASAAAAATQQQPTRHSAADAAPQRDEPKQHEAEQHVDCSQQQWAEKGSRAAEQKGAEVEKGTEKAAGSDAGAGGYAAAAEDRRSSTSNPAEGRNSVTGAEEEAESRVDGSSSSSGGGSQGHAAAAGNQRAEREVSFVSGRRSSRFSRVHRLSGRNRSRSFAAGHLEGGRMQHSGRSSRLSFLGKGRSLRTDDKGLSLLRSRRSTRGAAAAAAVRLRRRSSATAEARAAAAGRPLPLGFAAEGEEHALSFNQLLLRGTSMVETKWAYGAVVYTGRRTRLMQNSLVGSKQKWSRLELNYSSHVVVMILIQLISVLVLAFTSIYWIEAEGYRAPYLRLRKVVTTVENFGITFGATFLIIASFIPIDLFMMWEICRFVEGLFINFDQQMRCSETHRLARSQAGQLIEEMGNVTHVYSDKTGTLTKNIMELKCLGFGSGFEYGMQHWCTERASINLADKKFHRQMLQLKEQSTQRSAICAQLSMNAGDTLTAPFFMHPLSSSLDPLLQDGLPHYQFPTYSQLPGLPEEGEGSATRLGTDLQRQQDEQQQQERRTGPVSTERYAAALSEWHGLAPGEGNQSEEWSPTYKESHRRSVRPVVAAAARDASAAAAAGSPLTKAVQRRASPYRRENSSSSTSRKLSSFFLDDCASRSRTSRSNPSKPGGSPSLVTASFPPAADASLQELDGRPTARVARHRGHGSLDVPSLYSPAAGLPHSAPSSPYFHGSPYAPSRNYGAAYPSSFSPRGAAAAATFLPRATGGGASHFGSASRLAPLPGSRFSAGAPPPWPGRGAPLPPSPQISAAAAAEEQLLQDPVAALLRQHAAEVALRQPTFLRGGNMYVSLDRTAVARSCLRASPVVQDRMRHFFLIMGVCHTVLVRETKQRSLVKRKKRKRKRDSLTKLSPLLLSMRRSTAAANNHTASTVASAPTPAAAAAAAAAAATAAAAAATAAAAQAASAAAAFGHEGVRKAAEAAAAITLRVRHPSAPAAGSSRGLLATAPGGGSAAAVSDPGAAAGQEAGAAAARTAAAATVIPAAGTAAAESPRAALRTEEKKGENEGCAPAVRVLPPHAGSKGDAGVHARQQRLPVQQAESNTAEAGSIAAGAIAPPAAAGSANDGAGVCDREGLERNFKTGQLSLSGRRLLAASMDSSSAAEVESAAATACRRGHVESAAKNAPAAEMQQEPGSKGRGGPHRELVPPRLGWREGGGGRWSSREETQDGQHGQQLKQEKGEAEMQQHGTAAGAPALGTPAPRRESLVSAAAAAEPPRSPQLLRHVAEHAALRIGSLGDVGGEPSPHPGSNRSNPPRPHQSHQLREVKEHQQTAAGDTEGRGKAPAGSAAGEGAADAVAASQVASALDAQSAAAAGQGTAGAAVGSAAAGTAVGQWEDLPLLSEGGGTGSNEQQSGEGQSSSSSAGAELWRSSPEATSVRISGLRSDVPQYDASSPDELCLVSASNYFGLEFAARPSLMELELQLTSSFMVELLLGWKFELDAAAAAAAAGTAADTAEAAGRSSEAAGPSATAAAAEGARGREASAGTAERGTVASRMISAADLQQRQQEKRAQQAVGVAGEQQQQQQQTEESASPPLTTASSLSSPYSPERGFSPELLQAPQVQQQDLLQQQLVDQLERLHAMIAAAAQQGGGGGEGEEPVAADAGAEASQRPRRQSDSQERPSEVCRRAPAPPADSAAAAKAAAAAGAEAEPAAVRTGDGVTRNASAAAAAPSEDAEVATRTVSIRSAAARQLAAGFTRAAAAVLPPAGGGGGTTAEATGGAGSGRLEGNEERPGGGNGDAAAREERDGTVTLPVPVLRFEVLDVLEFDNVRKRMSVITRGFDGRLLLLSKGADNQMMDVAAPGQEEHIVAIDAQLRDFASSGLRTLVFGYRYLSEEEYNTFHRKYTAAKQLTGEAQENAIAKCVGEVEKDFCIVGCSGIEDKLRDGVQATIRDLKVSGMKVWVLTGDKLETAINIGHSTNLISENAYNAIIDGHTKKDVQDQIAMHERHCQVANLLGGRGSDVDDSRWWQEIEWGDLDMDPEEDEEVRELVQGEIQRRSMSSRSRKSSRGLNGTGSLPEEVSRPPASQRSLGGRAAVSAAASFRRPLGGRQQREHQLAREQREHQLAQEEQELQQQERELQEQQDRLREQRAQRREGQLQHPKREEKEKEGKAKEEEMREQHLQRMQKKQQQQEEEKATEKAGILQDQLINLAAAEGPHADVEGRSDKQKAELAQQQQQRDGLLASGQIRQQNSRLLHDQQQLGRSPPCLSPGVHSSRNSSRDSEESQQDGEEEEKTNEKEEEENKATEGDAAGTPGDEELEEEEAAATPLQRFTLPAACLGVACKGERRGSREIPRQKQATSSRGSCAVTFPPPHFAGFEQRFFFDPNIADSVTPPPGAADAEEGTEASRRAAAETAVSWRPALEQSFHEQQEQQGQSGGGDDRDGQRRGPRQVLEHEQQGHGPEQQQQEQRQRPEEQEQQRGLEMEVINQQQGLREREVHQQGQPRRASEEEGEGSAPARMSFAAAPRPQDRPRGNERGFYFLKAAEEAVAALRAAVVGAASALVTRGAARVGDTTGRSSGSAFASSESAAAAAAAQDGVTAAQLGEQLSEDVGQVEKAAAAVARDRIAAGGGEQTSTVRAGEATTAAVGEEQKLMTAAERGRGEGCQVVRPAKGEEELGLENEAEEKEVKEDEEETEEGRRWFAASAALGAGLSERPGRRTGGGGAAATRRGASRSRGALPHHRRTSARDDFLVSPREEEEGRGRRGTAPEQGARSHRYADSWARTEDLYSRPAAEDLLPSSPLLSPASVARQRRRGGSASGWGPSGGAAGPSRGDGHRGPGVSADATEETAAKALQQERQQQQQQGGGGGGPWGSPGVHRRSSVGNESAAGGGLRKEVTLREYNEFCITVTGEALGVIMKDRLLKISFYSLARHASTLIASRVTPKQKALLVKQNSAFNPRGTSLAIGDGANDVAMILAASVGVGIAGKEGLQAARAADFSIGDFKFLRKLLFVHGREALRRNCILVYTCIFRNAATCWSTLAMNFVCGFSGLDVWNPWTKQVVSIAFTCLPILAFVTMDRQVPHEVLMQNPVLYEVIPSTFWPYYSYPHITRLQTVLHAVFVRPVQRLVSGCWRHVCAPPLQRLLQQQKVDLSPLYAWAQHRKKPENDRCYGTHCLFLWLLYALWVAVCELVLLLFSSVGAWTPYVTKAEGFPTVQFDSFTQIIQLNYILVVNGVVALLSNTWTTVQLAVHLFESCAAVLFWLVVSYWRLFLSVVGAEVLHGTFVMVSVTAPYYFALMVTLVACLLPLAVPMLWQYLRRPTLEQLIVEQLALGTYDRLDVRRGRPEGIAYVSMEASAHRAAARRAAATMAAEAAAAAAAAEGADAATAAAEGAAAAEAAAAKEEREGEEYTGFAFTQEPIFNVLSGLQEAFRAVRRTGGGAKHLLKRTQTFILRDTRPTAASGGAAVASAAPLRPPAAATPAASTSAEGEAPAAPSDAGEAAAPPDGAAAAATETRGAGANEYGGPTASADWAAEGDGSKDSREGKEEKEDRGEGDNSRASAAGGAEPSRTAVDGGAPAAPTEREDPGGRRPATGGKDEGA